MKKIFITGGTGFIGRSFVQFLRKNQDYDIYLLTRTGQPVFENCHCVLGDLSFPDSYCQALQAIRPQILVHFAWDVASVNYVNAVQNRAWVQWSQNLAENFLETGGSHIIVSGTCFEYDWSAGKLLKETDCGLPVTFYGQCKLETYKKIYKLCKSYHARLVWGRIFYPYGPEEEPRKLIRYALETWKNKQPFFCETPENIIDYIYIQDIVNIFAVFVENLQAVGIYNVCTGKGQCIVKMLQYIRDEMHLPANFLQVVDVKKPIKIVGDIQKLQSLGYVAKYNFIKGMNDYLSCRADKN